MTIETGLRIDGRILPGTEWVFRDTRAWWSRWDRGVRPRRERIELVVGHWTAGAPLEGLDVAHRVVSAMKARRRPDGSPLTVGCHFVVGWDGRVWQVADIMDVVVHVGMRSINVRSIGIECAWPGTRDQAERVGMHSYGVTIRPLQGRLREFVAPSEALRVGWIRLCETLASIEHPSIAISRQAVTSLRRLSVEETRSLSGAIEHLHVPGTQKLDAAGLLTEMLVRIGWTAIA